MATSIRVFADRPPPAPASRPRSRRTIALASAAAGLNSNVMASIGRHLQRLRDTGRRAVNIVDVQCGDGAVALAAARKARLLGFVAITVRGFDASAARIHAARRRAGAAVDPAVGIAFHRCGRDAQLPLDDGDADILLIGDGDVRTDEIDRIRTTDCGEVRH